MIPAHEHGVRVRYAETDAQAVAHHGAYVAWLEEARIELLRGLGYSYRELEAAGVLMPVVALRLEYRSPARFDDPITIRTVASVDGRFRVRFASRLCLLDRLLAEAEVVVACVDPEGRLQTLPAPLRQALHGA